MLTQTNKEIRQQAMSLLTGRWKVPVQVALVYFIIMGLMEGPPSIFPEETAIRALADFVSGMASLLITGPLAFGMAYFYMNVVRQGDYSLNDMFRGFSFFKKNFILNIIIIVRVILWMVLLIVPGILAALRYSQAFYVLCDNPDLSPTEALAESSRLMEGHKGQYVMLGISFIGWALLGVITLGIGFLWITPYMGTSFALFYQELLEETPAG